MLIGLLHSAALLAGDESGGRTPVQLAATVAGGSTLSATVRLRRRVAGAVAGGATLTATLSVRRRLAPAPVVGGSTVDATLRVTRRLTATLAGGATLTASLTTGADGRGFGTIALATRPSRFDVHVSTAGGRFGVAVQAPGARHAVAVATRRGRFAPSITARPRFAVIVTTYPEEGGIVIYPELYLSNDYPIKVELADGVKFAGWAPDDGAGLPVAAFLSATDGSDGTDPVPIHADLRVDLMEGVNAETSAPEWTGGIAGAALRANLAAQAAAEATVYLVARSGDVFCVVGDVTVLGRREVSA